MLGYVEIITIAVVAIVVGIKPTATLLRASKSISKLKSHLEYSVLKYYESE